MLKPVPLRWARRRRSVSRCLSGLCRVHGCCRRSGGLLVHGPFLRRRQGRGQGDKRMRIVRSMPPAGGVLHQALGPDGLTGTDLPKAESKPGGTGDGQMTFGGRISAACGASNKRDDGKSGPHQDVGMSISTGAEDVCRPRSASKVVTVADDPGDARNNRGGPLFPLKRFRQFGLARP
jgi:hypothetical protein